MFLIHCPSGLAYSLQLPAVGYDLKMLRLLVNCIENSCLNHKITNKPHFQKSQFWLIWKSKQSIKNSGLQCKAVHSLSEQSCSENQITKLWYKEGLTGKQDRSSLVYLVNGEN